MNLSHCSGSAATDAVRPDWLRHAERACYFVAAALLAASAARGAEPAKAKPAALPPAPTINIDVTQWVVFVADPSYAELNRRGGIDNNLPPLVGDLRSSRAAAVEGPGQARPGPLGVIRIARSGLVNKDESFDVKLGYQNGHVLGHWPAGRSRASGLLWQDVRVAGELPPPRPLPESSWLNQLRAGGAMFAAGGAAESFLLYDLELSHPVAIQVSGSDTAGYHVAHGMSSPLHDLTLYKRAADGNWRTATVASLQRSATVKAPAVATSDAAPGDDSGGGGPLSFIVNALTPRGRVVVQKTVNANGTVTVHKVVEGPAKSTTPAASPAGSPAAKPGETPNMKLGALAQPEAEVLAPWRGRLAAAGVSAADQEIVLKMLARYALDRQRLTAVYQMDPAELDKLLPLEIVPQPKKISRIALVIVTQIDPSIGNDLDRLIAQLGDPSWKQREAAMSEIRKLGNVAKPRLQEAVTGKDTEIVYRAEQLLEGLSALGQGPSPDDAGAAPPDADTPLPGPAAAGGEGRSS